MLILLSFLQCGMLFTTLIADLNIDYSLFFLLSLKVKSAREVVVFRIRCIQNSSKMDFQILLLMKEEILNVKSKITPRLKMYRYIV